MSFIDIFITREKRKEIGQEYIKTLICEEDKSKKERLKYKVEFSGEVKDTLLDENSNTKIYTEETKHFANRKNANDFAVVKSSEGFEVEVWHLLKRF